MEFIIKKFCRYLLTGKEKNDLDEINKFIQENNLNYKKIKKQAQSEIKKLKKSISTLGYTLEYESVIQCLNEYISIKDNLNDEEKTNYLKILKSITDIYEIDLKKELEKHISYKQIMKRETLLNKFCRYQINSESTTEEYNELRNLCISNNYNFNELQHEAYDLTEPIKEATEQLGYSTDFNSFCNLLDYYCLEHSNFSEDKKEEYLKVLLQLSQIYEVDLRNEINNYMHNHETQSNDYELSNILDSLSNPLNNIELINKLLETRLEDGYFDINNIKLSNYKEPLEEDYDYTDIQTKLTKRIFDIFLTKINNYADQDLNKMYLNLLTEDDINKLSEITEEDINKIIIGNKKGTNKEDIINELNISETLYNFIKISTETTNFTNPHIGIANSSLFSTRDTFYTIRIYINTPNSIKTPEFLSLYIEKCILNDISYDCTGITEEKTILYATENDLAKKLEILNEIKNSNKELIASFGTPNYGGGTLKNNYYSISHAGLLNDNKSCMCSYNEYFNNICEVAYYRTLSKIIINALKKEEEKEIINNFIELDNIEFTEDYNNLLTAKYNGIEFSKIKDLINVYIPLVINTIKKYIEQKDNLSLEFKKSCIYLSNICEERDKKEKSNIAISRYLEEIAYKQTNKRRM